MQNEIISDKDRKARKAAEKAEKANKFLNKKVVFNKVSEKKREIKTSVEVSSFTPLGKKKNVEKELPKSYCPTYTEEGWFQWWEQQGYFKPEYNENKSNETFVIMIPPPNVTGVLHIGHALTLSIEDCLVRWNRMKGKQTLWLPGTDHAGIATQTVVEKKLQRENNLSRHDLGREKFVDEIWKWKNEKGDRIIEQLKKVGSSCDFSRLKFTMDESMSTAVKEAFVRLFEMGVIYRAKRLVNWSCVLRSAISDIEVDKIEIKGRTGLSVPGYERKIDFGQMVRFEYLIKDSEERLTVATTRIETMLGDTAVAVHPNDTRYTHLHGGYVVHPFRENAFLPIILDDAVDPSFGTGVVKITPAHDATDFAIGQRHGLDMPTIFTDDGCIRPGYGRFSGMPRFDARVAVIEDLTKLGLFVDIADHSNVLPMCSKSKDIIEPMLKDQWFLKCKDSALDALAAQKRGDLRLLPEKVHDKEWQHWLQDCHDWCISRQLWWGHRIPAYKVVTVHGAPVTSETWVAARSDAEAITAAAVKLGVDSADVVVAQDEDVLDTWFSSQLFPFATLGWPQQTSDLDKFYPGDVLETGHDILFFWVARMVMIGQRMTGRLPFSTVYLHAMIRDAHGRKMSKSLGNVLDPYDVINGISLADLQRRLETGNLDPRELDRAKAGQAKDFPNGIPECGTDALRFALLAYTVQPRDINLDVLRVNGYRNFCNKIWQAFRYCQMFGVSKTTVVGPLPVTSVLSGTDRWILARLAHTVAEVNQALAAYNFAGATTALHRFWIYDFCDVYIEYSKRLRTNVVRQPLLVRVLFECLSVGLRLLHPMMPFITEELYQRLPLAADETEESICVSRYPLASDYSDGTLADDDESQLSMNLVTDVLRRVRVYRKDIGLLDKQDLTVSVALSSPASERVWGEYLADVILPLSRSVVLADGSHSVLATIIDNEDGLTINHVTESDDAIVAHSAEHFLTVRSSAEDRQRVTDCLRPFIDGRTILSHTDDARVRQWHGYLCQQSLRGKAAVYDTLTFVDGHLLSQTYVAGTKTATAADALLRDYLARCQADDKMLSRYHNVARWLSTINNQ